MVLIGNRGILFSIFDKQRGPVPIFFENITKEEASHIAQRSQMTLLMMSSAEVETAEAILQFSEIKRISFILLFQIPTLDGSKLIASLFYLVPQAQQVFLYNKVSILKLKAEELASKIQQQYKYSEKQVLPLAIANLLKEWRIATGKEEDTVHSEERKVALSEKKAKGSVSFFLSQVKKNEDRALGAIFREKTILVTGDPGLVDLLVHSMDMLVPIISLRKIGYTETFVDPSYADIIGISTDLVKRYPNEVIILIKKKQVKNGETCQFSKQLIKNLRKNPDTIDEVLRSSTKKLLEVVGLLVDAFTYSEDERNQKIDEIKKNNNTGLVELAAEIGGQRNPLIREILMNKVSAKFIDWMEEL